MTHTAPVKVTALFGATVAAALLVIASSAQSATPAQTRPSTAPATTPSTGAASATKPTTQAATGRGAVLPTSPEVRLANTTTAHLLGAQIRLENALTNLNTTPNDVSGGFAEKAKANVDLALKDITEALDYVKQHPEIDPMVPSNKPLQPRVATQPPAFAIIAAQQLDRELSGTVARGRVVAIGPQDSRGIRIDHEGKGISAALVNALQDINSAGSLFSGSPWSPNSGIREICGFRIRILDHIDAAAKDTLAGLDYIYNHTSGPPVKPTFAGPGYKATDSSKP
jgi:hypothetical protein